MTKQRNTTMIQTLLTEGGRNANVIKVYLVIFVEELVLVLKVSVQSKQMVADGFFFNNVMGYVIV